MCVVAYLELNCPLPYSIFLQLRKMACSPGWGRMEGSIAISDLRVICRQFDPPSVHILLVAYLHVYMFFLLCLAIHVYTSFACHSEVTISSCLPYASNMPMSPR